MPANPFDHRARSDPYPVYQYMRTVEPIHHNMVGYWILTRYDDCRAVLEDARWSHDADRILEPARGDTDPVDATVRLLRASVAFADGTEHARHRRALEQPLKSALRGTRSRVARVASDLIKLMRDRESDADLVRDYASPLSIVVMSDLMGFPAASRAALLRMSSDLAAGIDPNVGRAGILRAGAGAAAMVEYLLDRFDARQPAGPVGVVDEIIGKSGKARTWELVADITVLFVLGVEATRNLIGNAMLALLRNAGQLEALRQRPALIDSGLDELIRFDGPLHLTARAAKEDIDIAGTRIPAGEQVLVILGAADRDPAQFADPERLDLARQDNPHLGFGLGNHACFAAPLARGIGGAAIIAAATGMAGLELAGDPTWNETVTMRGLRRLPVRFRT